MPTLDPRFNFMKVFRLWHETRLLNGYHLRMDADPGGIACDMEHSALLRRLLDGKDPLFQPPPHRYSYPDYDLIDNGSREIRSEVLFDAKSVVIDQATFQIIDQDANGYVLSYTIVDTDAVKAEALTPKYGYSLQRYNEERSGPLPQRLALMPLRLRSTGTQPNGKSIWRLETCWRREE